ncbi:hypothetical protein ACFLR3_00890 [Campylobacterota bacterium]
MQQANDWTLCIIATIAIAKVLREEIIMALDLESYNKQATLNISWINKYYI